MSDHTTHNIPYGYCHCGCGQKTTLARTTGKGYKRGQPHLYLHNHASRLTFEQQFWRYTATGTGDECWLWTGNKDRKGYGRLSQMRDGIRTTTGAHRFSYQLHYGPIADDIEVCHRCDNPPCVNPVHLFAGTQTDNIQDMMQKDRRYQPDVTGAANGRAKLTDELVRHLRQLHEQGMSYSKIAKLIDMDRQSVYRAVKGLSWSHVK